MSNLRSLWKSWPKDKGCNRKTLRSKSKITLANHRKRLRMAPKDKSRIPTRVAKTQKRLQKSKKIKKMSRSNLKRTWKRLGQNRKTIPRSTTKAKETIIKKRKNKKKLKMRRSLRTKSIKKWKRSPERAASTSSWRPKIRRRKPKRRLKCSVFRSKQKMTSWWKLLQRLLSWSTKINSTTVLQKMKILVSVMGTRVAPLPSYSKIS